MAKELSRPLPGTCRPLRGWFRFPSALKRNRKAKKPPVNGHVPHARSPPITYNRGKIDLHITELGREYVCGSRNLLPGRYNKKTTPRCRRLGYWPCPSRQIIAKKVIISTSLQRPPALAKTPSIRHVRRSLFLFPRTEHGRNNNVRTFQINFPHVRPVSHPIRRIYQRFFPTSLRTMISLRRGRRGLFSKIQRTPKHAEIITFAAVWTGTTFSGRWTTK